MKRSIFLSSIAFSLSASSELNFVVHERNFISFHLIIEAIKTECRAVNGDTQMHHWNEIRTISFMCMVVVFWPSSKAFDSATTRALSKHYPPSSGFENGSHSYGLIGREKNAVVCGSTRTHEVTLTLRRTPPHEYIIYLNGWIPAVFGM